MSRRSEKNPYDDELLTGGAAPEETFSLEDILAEYGGGRGQKVLRDVEREVAPEEPAAPSREKTAPQEEAVPREPERRRVPRKKAPEPQPEAPGMPELPKEPRAISLEEVVNTTVSAVMEEEHEILKPRRSLFSRRALEETEELYDSGRRREAVRAEREPERETIGPERSLSEAAVAFRTEYRRGRAMELPAFLLALLPTAVLTAERYGIVIPYWSGDPVMQNAALLVCLLLCCVLCRQVFIKAAQVLMHKRCSSECMVALAAILSAGDCIVALGLPERTAVTPYASVAMLALFFAQWGLCRENRGNYDTFRTAAMDDDPPYLVTETDRAACKQRGSVKGFYTTAMRDSGSLKWQTVFLPVIAMGSLVFAGLSSLGQGRGGDFLLHWSVIALAGATFSLSLCWGLPWAPLAARLQKTGCAVAGWDGAERISRKKHMIVTDTDLFPPGTVKLNGVKVYGEELGRAAAYAAAVAREAGCGLERLFEGLAISGGREKAQDFSFYEEGGYSATIHGESVLLGTASFMRKMDIRLPGGLNLKTGIFLAVDRQLAAVFAVKYNPAENVDYALRMMRRSGIVPVLASRDPNITPALLKRKFHKGVQVEYPGLTIRVALSEAGQDRGVPRALLFREGLLPYAEAVVGGRRLCSAVRSSTLLSLAGAAAGELLAFYLLSLGEYTLLNPLALTVFLLLWLLPVLLISAKAARF